MKVFSAAEAAALLDACAAYPRTLAQSGWFAYTVVGFTRAPADGAWRAEAAQRLRTHRGCGTAVSALAHKLARRLGLVVPRSGPAAATHVSHNCDWFATQAWVADADGRDVLLVAALPDVVWGTHFADVRGPLVAIVLWPPGANNDRARCVVHAVCLGADAWAYLDSAAAAFRARVCADVGDGAVAVRATMSHTPLCISGATLYLERVSLPREDETWSAELVRTADDDLRRLIFAWKS